MKKLTNWKTIALATILSLIVTLQPVITYACTTTSGGHCGG